MGDLLAGFDNRVLAKISRDLTTFHSVLGALRLTRLPQGYTNSVPEFQRCTAHVLGSMAPEQADVFIDDYGVKGPRSTYNNQPIAGNPRIRRFVYEYAATLDALFARFIKAGITASGSKLILATPRLQIVGSIVSLEGWHLEHGLVNKVKKWPECANVSEIRGFLGTAGVARRWIRGFALKAKPLTKLLRVAEEAFAFGEEQRQAMRELKDLVCDAPVLKTIDYDAARRITQGSRSSDDGLVVLAVDSSMYGAGWVLFQYFETDKHPILFGSCTFNPTESRYSQPKVELYGVFRAFKECRHRIWGIRFRLEVDASYLKRMIHEPDLPNAPMTRWVSYLQLFDFELKHIPAEKHRAPDGLSRRRQSEEDSEESDGETQLDKFIGAARVKRKKEEGRAWSVGLEVGEDTRRARDFVGIDRVRDDRGTIIGLEGVVEVVEVEAEVAKGGWLIRAEDETDLGTMFTRPREAEEKHQDYDLGGEQISLTYVEYHRDLKRPEREQRAVSAGERGERKKTHMYQTLEEDGPGLFEGIQDYLESGNIPTEAAKEKSSRRGFIRRADGFFVHHGRLWKKMAGRLPRLVVEEQAQRVRIIAQAHNDCGHRGRDPTYKKISERYYWPNMYTDITWFVRSCNACQLRDRTRKSAPLRITYSPSILRRFCLDTVHMPKGSGGKHFLLHASDDVSRWPEARAVVANNSKAWANFIWEDILCRYGSIPVCVCDGGSEFKGAVREIFERHGVKIILSTPYHPEGNGIAERDGQTLTRAILRSCGDNSRRWPLFLHAGLHAVRVTVNRMTGFTPYYLLYGKHALLPFDLEDRTWHTLDWEGVRSTEDLLTVRLQQIARKEEHIGLAVDGLKKNRQRSVDDYMRRNAHRIRDHEFEPGTWVLVHETWLDGQHGNKGALRWAGPYVVHEQFRTGSYALRELDGTVLKEHVAASRLKLFYYREERQVCRAGIWSGY